MPSTCTHERTWIVCWKGVRLIINIYTCCCRCWKLAKLMQQQPWTERSRLFATCNGAHWHESPVIVTIIIIMDLCVQYYLISQAWLLFSLVYILKLSDCLSVVLSFACCFPLSQPISPITMEWNSNWNNWKERMMKTKCPLFPLALICDRLFGMSA